MREPDKEFEAGLVQLIKKELDSITETLEGEAKIQDSLYRTRELIADYRCMERALERDARELRIHAECCMERIHQAEVKLKNYREYINGTTIIGEF